MEKFCRGGLGERQRMTQPPVKTRETCVPVSAPVSVELFIRPRKENLIFFFSSFSISDRKILFEICFVLFSLKSYTPIGRAGSSVLSTPLYE